MGLPSGCMTDFLESSLLDHLFRTSSYSKPGALAIALTSNTPSDSITGASMSEVPNAGGYARQTLSPSDTNWSKDSTTTGLTYNNVAITFPVATVLWGYASGVVLVDSATYGAGNALLYGLLNPPQLIDVSQQLVIPISGISFGLN